MRARRQKGNPLNRTAAITSGRPGFEKVVLGTTNVFTVLLAETSQLSTCQADREQMIIKGALCPRGEDEEKGGEKKSEIPMASDVTLAKPHPIYSHFLPHGSSFTPTPETLRYYS